MSIFRLFGLGAKKRRTEIKQMTVHAAHEGEKSGAIALIDVRKPEEWNETGRPQGSHGVTLQDQDFDAKVLALLDNDKSKPVAFSCRTGGRSSQAAEKARDAGHVDVSNVEGGFLAWQEAGLPIDKGPF